MVKNMVWVSGLLPYGQSREVLQRIGKQTISEKTLWQYSQVYAERLVTTSQVPPSSSTAPDIQGVSLDGGMIHIRGEGWKEFKVGAVFDVQQALKWNKKTQTHQLQACGVNVDYTATLGTVTQFEPLVAQFATAHGLTQAQHICITGDGADWIWGIAQRQFPEGIQVVDYYHALQHLHKASEVYLKAKPQSKPETIRSTWEADLFKGKLETIIQPLTRSDLPHLARYFEIHQHRMQYQQFRDEGLPIGSGTIESGVKQFKARVTGAGMRWSRRGAENMLVLRAAVLSDHFDQRWDAA